MATTRPGGNCAPYRYGNYAPMRSNCAPYLVHRSRTRGPNSDDILCSGCWRMAGALADCVGPRFVGPVRQLRAQGGQLRALFLCVVGSRHSTHGPGICISKSQHNHLASCKAPLCLIPQAVLTYLTHPRKKSASVMIQQASPSKEL